LTLLLLIIGLGVGQVQAAPTATPTLTPSSTPTDTPPLTPYPAALCPASTCWAPPLINGDPGSAPVWSGDYSNFFNTVTVDSGGLASASFQSAYDTNYLYVAVTVTDPVLYYNAANVDWNNSAVELFFNANYPLTNDPLGPGDFQYIVDWSGNSQTCSCLTTVWGSSTGVLWGTSTTASGYDLEVAVPWSTLGLTPAAGLQLGFDVEVDINHSNPGTLGRTGQIAWSGSGGPYLDSSQDGTLTLVGACAPTITPTVTPCATPTTSPTVTGSWTPTASPCATATPSPSASPSRTLTATPTVSPTGSPSRSPSASPTATLTATPSQSPLATATPDFSPTQTPSPAAAAPTATPVQTGVYPNPFTPGQEPYAVAHFGLPSQHAGGQLSIFDLKRRQVRVIPFDEGQDVTWDGRDSAGRTVLFGVYPYFLQCGTRVSHGTVTVMR
jgi:hypothetical protein